MNVHNEDIHELEVRAEASRRMLKQLYEGIKAKAQGVRQPMLKRRKTIFYPVDLGSRQLHFGDSEETYLYMKLLIIPLIN